jgi:hypothetical protein
MYIQKMLRVDKIDSLKEKWSRESNVSIIDFDPHNEGKRYLPHFLFLLTGGDLKDRSTTYSMESSRREIIFFNMKSFSFKFDYDKFHMNGYDVSKTKDHDDILDVMSKAYLAIVDEPTDLLIALVTRTPFYVITNNIITKRIVARFCPKAMTTNVMFPGDWHRNLESFIRKFDNKLLDQILPFHILFSQNINQLYNYELVDAYRDFILEKDRWDIPWYVLYDDELMRILSSTSERKLEFLTLTKVYVHRKRKAELLDILKRLTKKDKGILHNLKIKTITTDLLVETPST